MVHGSLLWVEFLGHGSGLISWFVTICYGSSVARLQWFSECSWVSTGVVGFWWVCDLSLGGGGSNL